MARRHTSGFDIVGMSSDPTPGDIDEMARVRDRYKDVGDQADVALNFLKKGGAVESGRGQAMDALNKQIGDLPDKLQKTVTSFHDAAEAYTQYAPKLVEAQDLLDKAMDQAASVAGQAAQSAPTLAPDATDEQKTSAKQQQDKISEAQDQLSAAKSMAQQAKELREQAQRACADVLDKAAGEAIPERNIFQKIADFFKDFPFIQILLGILIAVVAVFFPVVGALLGGALFVFNQVVASQTGGIKPGDFLSGLLGIIPGGSLLKLGGKAVQAIPGLAKALQTGAGLIGKVTAPIAKVGDTLANTKIVGGLINSPLGKVGANPIVKDTIGKIATDGAVEVGIDGFDKAVTHQKFDPTAVIAGVVGGAIAGGAVKGGFGSIAKKFGGGKAPASGTFGNTAESAPGDSLGKRAADQVGSTVEEGASIGAKVGVGAAQGKSPEELAAIAAQEATNSSSKIGAGAVGRGAVTHGVDSIPIKGTGAGTGAGAGAGAGGKPTLTPLTIPGTQPHTDVPSAPTTPVQPASVPLPPSPTSPTTPTTPTTGDGGAGAGRPTLTPLTIPGTQPHTDVPAAPTSPVQPANVPLPPSPTSPTTPTTPGTPVAGSGSVSSPSSPSNDGFTTAPTSPVSPTSPASDTGGDEGFTTAPSSPTGN